MLLVLSLLLLQRSPHVLARNILPRQETYTPPSPTPITFLTPFPTVYTPPVVLSSTETPVSYATGVPTVSSTPSTESTSTTTITINTPADFNTSAVPTTVSPATSNTPAPAFVTSFSPEATSNLAVYFGHSTGNTGAPLSPLCTDPTISIIIIGFIRKFNGASAPTVDFGRHCLFGSNGKPSLCLDFATDVWKCQALGKKIFVSVGGSKSETSFVSEEDAVQQAEVIWNMFGEGLPENPLGASRPFGSLVVDGFDIDHENGPGDYYDLFALHLRSLFPQPRGTFFISSCPICAPKPAIALPDAFYAASDFLFPRFYNARACNLNGKGFDASWSDWVQYAQSLWTGDTVGDDGVVVERGSKWPKVYVGALSFENGVSGFAWGNGLLSGVSRARVGTSCEGGAETGGEEADNALGGVMLWDGTYGQRWSNYKGMTYNEVAKLALEAELVCSA